MHDICIITCNNNECRFSSWFRLVVVGHRKLPSPGLQQVRLIQATYGQAFHGSLEFFAYFQ